jgi:class 3 adenylate cyclase
MVQPPTGTVTFLFTDIEASTQLRQQLREEYATVLANQRRLLRESFGRFDGREVDTQGDAFFVAFARAGDAIRAHRLGTWQPPGTGYA